MSPIVFTGPSLTAVDASAVLDARYLPPVAQGDVYRAALTRPRAIGIIDGIFERVPAVWHKEILWALARGIQVYGSASMGALRAVELAAFGMIGIGAIFEAYRDGRLEDDDEVAVTHGPADAGFRQLSEAMVNIRCTLAAAETAGILSAETHAALTRIAKGLYYPERHYPTILERGRAEGLPAAELQGFRGWLPGGRVNQKRDDALAMLRAMRQALDEPAVPARPAFRLARSLHWELARRAAARGRPDWPIPRERGPR